MKFLQYEFFFLQQKELQKTNGIKRTLPGIHKKRGDPSSCFVEERTQKQEHAMDNVLCFKQKGLRLQLRPAPNEQKKENKSRETQDRMEMALTGSSPLAAAELQNRWCKSGWKDSVGQVLWMRGETENHAGVCLGN